MRSLERISCLMAILVVCFLWGCSDEEPTKTDSGENGKPDVWQVTKVTSNSLRSGEEDETTAILLENSHFDPVLDAIVSLLLAEYGARDVPSKARSRDRIYLKRERGKKNV